MTRAERREHDDEVRDAAIIQRLELGKAPLRRGLSYRCECGRRMWFGRPEHVCGKCGRPRRSK